MSFQDYVKYMTEQFLEYIETPENEREKQRRMKKAQKQPRMYRWFGLIPYSLRMIFFNK